MVLTCVFYSCILVVRYKYIRDKCVPVTQQGASSVSGGGTAANLQASCAFIE